MTKLKNAECISLLITVLCFILMMFQSMQKFSLFETSEASVLFVILFGLTVLAGLSFLVIYVINSVVETTKLYKCFRFICPVVFILYSIVNVNGFFSFDFMWMNIATAIWGIFVILLYNFYIFNYHGKDIKCPMSMALFNLTVMYFAFGEYMKFIVNFYLGFLPFAILVSYFEYLIQIKMRCKDEG